MGLDDGAAEGEAESHSARFGGDERVEDRARDLGLDPRPVIVDDDFDAVTRAADVGAERASAARRQSFDGIEIKVGEHALHQNGVATDDEIGRLDGDRKGDVGGKHDRSARAVEERGDVGGLEGDRFAASKSEHCADDALRATNLHAHLVEMAHELVLIVEVAPREKKGRLGDRERIAELMGDARSYRAGAGQPGRSFGEIVCDVVAWHRPNVPLPSPRSKPGCPIWRLCVYSRRVTTTDLYGIEGQVLDGQFRVDRAIGEGGFSVVYRGLHIGLDEPVAIKCLKLQAPLQSSVVDSIVRRFRDESKIHYRLSRGSLHIARTIAAGTTMAPATGALVPYMVLEWLEGFTLAEELRARRMRGENGRTLPEVIRLLDPIADAMAFAHAQGVVHRDLNPSNIFVAHTQGTSKLKVLDFGVAKVISDHALSLGPRVATIGQIRMFTPAYAAPEQFHDALGVIGPYTDVYSFAVLLVELLADRTPIEGEHIGEYADRALDPGRRPTPRSMGVVVGDAVEAVLARAVTVDPSQRPRDIGEFWGMLKNAATRDAHQSRGVGEIGFPQPPGMAAPSARGADVPKVTAGGLPILPDPRVPRPPREVADLVPDTRGSGWRPDAAVGFANTMGAARSPSAPPLDETQEANAGVRAGPPRKATLFQGTPAIATGSAPKAVQTSASSLPPPPLGGGVTASPLPAAPGPGGIASNTAFAATVGTGPPNPQTAPTLQSLHLGDTAPSAVLRAAMSEGKAAKPHVRWYTPSLDSNTPFPATPSSIPTPPSAQEEPSKAPKPRRMIVIAITLTVALVLAAVLANYFSPQ